MNWTCFTQNRVVPLGQTHTGISKGWFLTSERQPKPGSGDFGATVSQAVLCQLRRVTQTMTMTVPMPSYAILFLCHPPCRSSFQVLPSPERDRTGRKSSGKPMVRPLCPLKTRSKPCSHGLRKALWRRCRELSKRICAKPQSLRGRTPPGGRGPQRPGEHLAEANPRHRARWRFELRNRHNENRPTNLGLQK